MTGSALERAGVLQRGGSRGREGRFAKVLLIRERSQTPREHARGGVLESSSGSSATDPLDDPDIDPIFGPPKETP